ncbi:MAG: haloperoxidase, partial [Flavobacteriaceae bacterium]
MMKSTIKKNVALLLGVLLFIQCNTSPKSLTAKENPTGADNVAYYWAKTALEATARDTERFSPRPTITSRYLGLIFIAVFDAWSAYDQKATPVYLKQKEKLKGGLLEKEIAISYAAYHTLKEYYFSDSLYYKEQMQKLGLDPSLRSMDLSTPEGIGYAAAKAVIEARKGDGANQYGEEMAGEQPYFDYTHYEPVNPPDQNNDINRWQPKYFINGKGEQYAPGCLTPYWQNV